MKKQTLKRTILIIFLVFVVVGFTAPLVDFTFFEDASTSNLPPQLKDPKLCVTDTDCALTCDSPNDPILCIQNICAQTECKQEPLYYYSQIPTIFNLKVSANNKSLPLIVDPKNLFVSASEEKISIFSPSLPLIAVLEKFGITFNQNCMIQYKTEYCQDETHQIKLAINGKEDLNLGYIPTDGDIVILDYLTITNSNTGTIANISTNKNSTSTNISTNSTPNLTD